MMKRSLYIALAALILGLPGLTLFTACSNPGPKPESRAAIVDQLCVLLPNQVFIEQATRELEEYGFSVDVYSDEAVTVDLYRELPAYGYKLIIFRVHSGLLGVDPKVINRTWLYTNELYSKTSHLIEQLDDQVTYARTHEDAPWCFAISAEFIENSVEGQFNDTAIIMMGCDALHFEDMAQAFIQKGASTYIAWDASVILNYVDSTTPTIIEKLCSDESTIEEAVAQTMADKGTDPKFNSILKYYPRQCASKTLSQLIE
jgi:hypothetical protein